MKKCVFASLSLLFLISFVLSYTSILAFPSKLNKEEKLVTNCTENYIGHLSHVRMRGKEKQSPKEEVTATVTRTVSGEMTLQMSLPKIGKMPGRMRIYVPHIKVDRTGYFRQTVKDALIMRMLFSHKYNAEIEGRIGDRSFSFTFKTIKATYLGVDVSAEFEFVGCLK
ncbi:hypothetical protein [Falsiporphyromonas endometrii]|uniref:Uncharacterized protein n=1 Tax=Falsiporphyromonas endometrii TaxID=1387297 RepID=A0ABV9K883_9PORP